MRAAYLLIDFALSSTSAGYGLTPNLPASELERHFELTHASDRFLMAFVTLYLSSFRGRRFGND